jgi:excisionase family DNA binding protein
MSDGLLLDLKQVCAQLRVSYSTVRNLVASGKLPTLRIGRRRLVSRTSLEAFIAEAEGAMGRPRAEVEGEIGEGGDEPLP